MDGTYWLMVFTLGWAHVFGAYADRADCMTAAREAFGVSTCELRESPLPKCACIPRPGPLQDKPALDHDHPRPSQNQVPALPQNLPSPLH